ncbi:type I restriction endonuclease subunit R [Larkinella sp. GY13]|uniref:type I restriction endonuclease subunit R n=1 Tax=Larkinella sp. GY13 TaxID=3453720 RepID=UPI003EE9DAC3
MNTVGQPERHTQNRIVKLFRDKLHYGYLGNWEDRTTNSNIEEALLHSYLINNVGYSPELVKRAIYKLQSEATNYDGNLYNNNKEVYKLLRYGLEVMANPGEKYQRVHFINWDKPETNHFAIAEEVTIQGNREKRPDIVLYINGIAVGVLELKRSIVSIGDGIRQNLVNQRAEFIQPFFSTIQLVMAGSDAAGLRYGTIGTEEKFFLQWKEDENENSLLKLDKYLIKLCTKNRLLEVLHDFVLFDGGKKKLPRHHQYFGIKAAQEHVRRREGGIIWHTQGSGKSIVMVLLAKWILENNPNARVVILTDRTELDKQIERVFNDAGEPLVRTSSGQELMEQLSQPMPRLLCSLVHKFGKKDVENFDKFIDELQRGPSAAVGEVFVFVDECHRTQSGKLHKIMKAMLHNAVFIGFTGTPLLKSDRQTSLEVFGKYIHTYKFNEAVADEVVLDLVYESRDIDQRLTSPRKVDEWFELTTESLNDFQKSELKKKWGTMQKVLSSKNRMEKIVLDIQHDFRKKPRLSSHFGNAILVAGSIYEACKYYELFQRTEFKKRCAVITSYNPATKDINTEDTGANTETDKEFIYNIYTDLLERVTPVAGKTRTETHEDIAKKRFIKEPATMRLLIVVDKLLTGFDAPTCTYLYIDKKMQDHGLFQAICRVNRLDSDDKQFGYIVDYKELFKNLVNDKGTGAIQVYTSELDYDQFQKEDCDILLQDRVKKGRERLDNALEVIVLLCEPVDPPKSELDYQHYFCGNTEIPEELKNTELRRTALYKATVALIRAYANLAAELDEAGYSAAEQDDIKKQVDFYLKLREEIRIASGEVLDLKAYEADMRHLIDHYIQAEEPTPTSPFGDLSLIELIVQSGLDTAIDKLPDGIKGNQQAVAETIENNVRQKIIKDHLIDPAFFEDMSKLLSEIIKERKANAITYAEYLKQMADLAATVQAGKKDNVPIALRTPAQRALYNNLDHNEALAIKVHENIIEYKPNGWRGVDTREKVVKKAIYEVLGNVAETERIFDIVKKQGEY